MNDPGPLPDQPAQPSGAPPPSSIARWVFFNPVELRAGWRLLIFAAIIAAMIGVLLLLARLGGHPMRRVSELTVRFGLIGESLQFLLPLIAAAIMSRIERRGMGYYGLPLRQAFGRNFWLGALWGFVALSVLVASIHALGDFDYGNLALHGFRIWKYAAGWGAVFLLVGFAEEYLLRGYPQFTLTTGIGFWPAAVLLSLFFAFMHSGNPGEDPIGLISVVMVALFFCFTLKRTGALWFAVGFHAAWDWGESYFYGTPDSGLLARGHLLASKYSGSKIISGGTAGPEGSIFIIPLILLLFVVFHFLFRKRAIYPDPAALKIGGTVPSLS